MFLKHDFTILTRIVFSKQNFDHIIIYNREYIIRTKEYIACLHLHRRQIGRKNFFLKKIDNRTELKFE